MTETPETECRCRSCGAAIHPPADSDWCEDCHALYWRHCSLSGGHQTDELRKRILVASGLKPHLRRRDRRAHS